MCTVTILPFERGYGASGRGPAVRMVCNRDELRTRAIALPPEVREFGGVRAVMPVDPESDGTWVAVSEAGLMMTILNVNPPRDADAPAPPPGERSRGGVIPSLLHCSTLDDALAAARELDVTDYRPFRLAMLDRTELIELRSEGERLDHVRRGPIDRPYMLTSSGLGDHLVEVPRGELFRKFFARGEDWFSRQLEFHYHTWPDRPHLSVFMSRHDAQTVSITSIECDLARAKMSYQKTASDIDANVSEVSVHLIDLRPANEA